MKRIAHVLTFVLLFYSSIYAKTGPLFEITESGNTAAVDIILCLNGKTQLSCQNYHASAQDLNISATAKHYYPAFGIKILTPGYQATDCTPYSNGYCLFEINNSASVMIHLNSNTQKQNQTITFTSTPPSPAPVGGTYQVTATASSGLPVTITVDSSSSSVCSFNSGIVTFNAVGTCILDANQAGNTQYNAAPQVQQSIPVEKQNQTISFTSTPPSPAPVGGTYRVTATASSGLPVTITVDSSSSSVCSLSSGTVTFNTVGTCILDANQAGNAEYNAAPQMQQSIPVEKQNQTITFTSTPPSPTTIGSTYSVTATASSGLLVTITVDSSSSSVCSLSSGTVTFNAAGTCILDANQGGNAQYNAAPQAQQNITVPPILTTSTLVYSSLNPSTTSSTITLSAQVFSALGAPTSGTVSFTANGIVISGCSNQNLNSGVATCTTTSLNTATTYPIVATYNGNSGYATSTSPTFEQYVTTSAQTVTTPSAPTYVTSIPGNNQVTVNWLPPYNTGGASLAAITYTVTYWETATGSSSSSTTACSGITTLSCIATGLTNGTAYTFKVTSKNIALTASPYLAGYSSSVTPSDSLAVNSDLTLLVSGQSRSIRVINNSNSPQTITSVTDSDLPSGTTITDICTNSTLSANGGSCFIEIQPGTTVSYYEGGTTLCTAITTAASLLNPSSISINTDTSSATTNVYVVGYGCQYQGGYLFAIDDTTPVSGSIGGTVVTINSQSTSIVWTPNSTSIGGIANTSTISAPVPSYVDVNSGQLNCNGKYDGACNSNNIIVNSGIGTTYGAGFCHQPLSNSGSVCVSGATCYPDWYSLAICQLGSYTSGSFNSGCSDLSNTVSYIHNMGFLSGLVGGYWSSTESTSSSSQQAWTQFFINSTSSTSSSVNKSFPSALQCARNVTY